MNRPLVYISHPYTHGDQAANTRTACLWWKRLNDHGACLPMNPLWSALQQIVSPETHETWLEYDLDLIRSGKVDAIFRPNTATPSDGCDRECQLARELGIPVFLSESDLLDWAEAKETA